MGHALRVFTTGRGEGHAGRVPNGVTRHGPSTPPSPKTRRPRGGPRTATGAIGGRRYSKVTPVKGPEGARTGARRSASRGAALGRPTPGRGGPRATSALAAGRVGGPSRRTGRPVDGPSFSGPGAVGRLPTCAGLGRRAATSKVTGRRGLEQAVSPSTRRGATVRPGGRPGPGRRAVAPGLGRSTRTAGRAASRRPARPPSRGAAGGTAGLSTGGPARSPAGP